MKKIRTAIFGGTFDPIHNAHLSLARQVIYDGLAHEVWFMVSPHNPLKNEKELTPESMRLQMVELALENEADIFASDFEFLLPRPSFTIETLKALYQKYKDREFLLLIGGDNLANFPKWYKSEEILSIANILVYPRPGFDYVPSNIDSSKVIWIDAPLHRTSSTEVRNRILKGESVDKMLHPQVFDYIERKSLYIK